MSFTRLQSTTTTTSNSSHKADGRRGAWSEDARDSAAGGGGVEVPSLHYTDALGDNDNAAGGTGGLHRGVGAVVAVVAALSPRPRPGSASGTPSEGVSARLL